MFNNTTQMTKSQQTLDMRRTGASSASSAGSHNPVTVEVPKADGNSISPDRLSLGLDRLPGVSFLRAKYEPQPQESPRKGSNADVVVRLVHDHQTSPSPSPRSRSGSMENKCTDKKGIPEDENTDINYPEGLPKDLYANSGEVIRSSDDLTNDSTFEKETGISGSEFPSYSDANSSPPLTPPKPHSKRTSFVPAEHLQAAGIATNLVNQNSLYDSVDHEPDYSSDSFYEKAQFVAMNPHSVLITSLHEFRLSLGDLSKNKELTVTNQMLGRCINKAEELEQIIYENDTATQALTELEEELATLNETKAFRSFALDFLDVIKKHKKTDLNSMLESIANIDKCYQRFLTENTLDSGDPDKVFRELHKGYTNDYKERRKGVDTKTSELNDMKRNIRTLKGNYKKTLNVLKSNQNSLAKQVEKLLNLDIFDANDKSKMNTLLQNCNSMLKGLTPQLRLAKSDEYRDSVPAAKTLNQRSNLLTIKPYLSKSTTQLSKSTTKMQLFVKPKPTEPLSQTHDGYETVDINSAGKPVMADVGPITPPRRQTPPRKTADGYDMVIIPSGGNPVVRDPVVGESEG